MRKFTSLLACTQLLLTLQAGAQKKNPPDTIALFKANYLTFDFSPFILPLTIDD